MGKPSHASALVSLLLGLGLTRASSAASIWASWDVYLRGARPVCRGAECAVQYLDVYDHKQSVWLQQWNHTKPGLTASPNATAPAASVRPHATARTHAAPG